MGVALRSILEVTEFSGLIKCFKDNSVLWWWCVCMCVCVGGGGEGNLCKLHVGRLLCGGQVEVELKISVALSQ